MCATYFFRFVNLWRKYVFLLSYAFSLQLFGVQISLNSPCSIMQSVFLHFLPAPLTRSYGYVLLKQILKLFLSRIFFTGSTRFAESAHGYVGADLAAVCKEAGLMAFRRCLDNVKKPPQDSSFATDHVIKEHLMVTPGDLREAFRQVKPSAMREVAIDVPKVY